MALPVSAAFLAAQNLRSRHPRAKVEMLLRNVAAASAGSSILEGSGNDYSANFPGAGAIDGDRTHIRYGRNSGANNDDAGRVAEGEGKSGWRSPSMGRVEVTSAADFDAGKQTNVLTEDASIQLTQDSSAYDQDFDGLTPASSLAGQDSWTNEAGAATANVSAAAAYGGSGYGVQLIGTGAASGVTDQRTLTFGTIVTLHLRVRAHVAGDAASWFAVVLRDTSAGVDRVTVKFMGDGRVLVNGALTATGVLLTADAWYRLTLRLDRTAAAASLLRLFLSDATTAVEVDARTVDATGLSAVRLDLHQDTTAPEYWVDTLRLGGDFATSGTQVHDLDWTAAPSSGTGTVSWHAESEPVARLVAGAYSLAEAGDGHVHLFDDAARQGVIEVFTPTEAAPLDRVTVRLARVGNPTGQVRARLWYLAAGVPTTALEISSTGVDATALTVTETAYVLTWRSPHAALASTAYALELELVGGVVDAANYVTIGADVSGPAYSGGTVWTWDGATWTQDAATALTFAFGTELEEDTTYANANRTASLGLRNGVYDQLAQGFQLPYGRAPRAVRAFLQRANGTTALDSYQVWAELRANALDIYGRPIPGALLATSERRRIRDLEAIGATARATPTIAVAAATWKGDIMASGWTQTLALTIPGGLTNPVLWVFCEQNVGNTGGKTGMQVATVKWNTTESLALRKRAGAVDEAAPACSTEAWWKAAPTAGAYNVEVVVNSGGQVAGTRDAVIVAFVTDHTDQTTPTSAETAATGADTTDAVVAVTSSTGELVYASAASRQNHALTNTGTGTERWREEYGTGGGKIKAVGKSIPGSAGSVSTTWTSGGGIDSEWAAIAISIQGSSETLPTGFADLYFGFPNPLVEHVAGTQYHVVLAGDWPASGSAYLAVGCNLNGSYAGGNASLKGAGPSWISAYGPPPVDLCFAALGPSAPWIRFDGAYSTDGVTFSSYALMTDNPTHAQVGSGTFTGQAKRYWRIRAQLVRTFTGGSAHPWTPTLLDFTLDLASYYAKQITVDFGKTRTIRHVRLFAHPDRGGMVRVKLQSSTDNVTYTDVTTVDGDALEARRRGGGAGATWTSPEIEVDGDAVFVTLTADLSCRYLRIVFLATNDGYARLLEVEAYRMVDVTSRLVDFQENAGQDPLLRRCQARTVTLQLRNPDGALSPTLTTGPYYGELGEGVRFLLWSGYRNVDDLAKVGEFLVDEWPDECGILLTLPLADSVSNLTKDVQAAFRTGLRHHEIVEYLGNLAGHPSQQMILETSGQALAYFLPREVDAFQEMQTIAEALGLAAVYVDRDDNLVVRGCGTIIADVGSSALTVPATGPYGCRGAAYLNGKVYWARSSTTAAGGLYNRIYLIEYDLATGVLASKGYVAAAAGEYNLSIHPFAVGSKIVLVVSAASTTGFIVYDWDGATFTGRASQGVSAPSWGATDWCQNGTKAYFVVDSDRSIAEVDMVGYTIKKHALGTALGAGHRVVAITAESGSVYLAITSGAAAHPAVSLRRFDPSTSSYSAELVALSAATANDDPSGTLADTGVGDLYYLPRDGTATSMTLRLGRIDLEAATLTWFNTVGSQAPTKCGPPPSGGFSLGRSLGFANGIVVGMYKSSTGWRTLVHDEDGDRTIDAGALELGATFPGSLTRFTYSGADWLGGVLDHVRPFLVRARTRRWSGTTSAFTLARQSGGDLGKASIDSGLDRAGRSRIINIAIVKSSPVLEATASEELWKASNTPWRVSPEGSGVYSQPIELSKPAVPSGLTHGQTAAVTPAGTEGCTATAALSVHVQQPTLTVTVTVAGLLADLVVTGYPLEPRGTVIGVMVGEKLSRELYDDRPVTITNDYVIGACTASLIAASLVLARQYPTINIRGASARRAHWEMERFELVRVIIPSRTIDQVFYVAKYSRKWRQQTMTLELEAIEPTAPPS